MVDANEKLYIDRQAGFIGTGLKKAEFVQNCSDLDDIIIFYKDGKYKVIRIADKVFVGKGVGELVEGKIFIPTIIKGLNFPDWMRDWLGLMPYYESLIPQIIMVLALIIGIVIMKSKQNKN